MTHVLDEARHAYEQRDWIAARDGFLVGREHGELSTDDLAALADSAWWLGRNDEALAGFEEVYRRLRDDDRDPEAARLGLDLAFLWMLRGEDAIASAWMGRARRLLRELPECVEHGYALIIEVDQALASGDIDGAITLARSMRAFGERFQDPTLAALGLASEGIAMIKQGRVADGTATLDEAMLPVLAGEVAPDWAGNIYCQLMSVYHELAEIQRARQWTEATERWCKGFTSAVMVVGICRVHRSQLLQLQGEWSRAEEEAVLVCKELADMNLVAVAEGHYQCGEVRRLRNDIAGAETAYAHAHRLGRDPQPGLALLRLAQGQIESAAASMNAALTEAGDPLTRARLRSAQVEIALAAGDTATAFEAADDLDHIAATYASSGFSAMARQTRGAVLLANGDPAQALPVLREAQRRWQDLDAPHPAAQVRVLAAQACRALGDEDAAALDLDAAATVFDQLGASLDAKRVADLRGKRTLPGGLTEREAEVLACVAAGQTNREVATTLFIADKTVARHLSNIFTKLGVSSRTEAAAYAYRHGLVSHRRA